MSKNTTRNPRGTRDFFPEQMATRLWIEDAWRAASIRHGFQEIEGPMFEHLDVYTLKSGEGIVSELFSFKRDGGKDTYALRPEFTPTLARMVAARGGSEPRPIKWFALPSHFRAERPQRGRLREFRQWNVDMLGLDDPSADAEVIATAVDCLCCLGLGPDTFRVRVSHRDAVAAALQSLGVAEAKMTAAFELLDRRDKLPNDVFAERAAGLGLTTEALAGFDALANTSAPITTPLAEIADRAGIDAKVLAPMEAYGAALVEAGLDAFCDWDLGIVRGLAYYTGGVFEIRDASGTERAIAGGGRYDGLVELFGGQPTSAVGFGMGDVVLGLLLESLGLLADAAPPQPGIFVLSASEKWDALLRTTMHALRRRGLHVQRSYRATRNLGKLLGEAGKRGASSVLIFDDACEGGVVQVKNLTSGDQQQVALDTLETFFFEHDEWC